MKKLFSLFLVLCLIFSLSACGGNETATDNDTGSSTTQNQTDVTDTNSTEQSTDTPSSITDNSGSSDSTDVPSSTTQNQTDVTDTNSTEQSTDTPSSTTDNSGNSDSTDVPNSTTTTKPETSKPTESSKPTHTHSYSGATCTVPAECSCGATEGEALGHNWKDGKCQVCNNIMSKYTTEVFLDEFEGISFTYTGISYNHSSFKLTLRVTNDTDEMAVVQLRNEKVNGHSGWITMSEYVKPKTTQDVTISISANGSSPSLNDYGEDIVEYVSFNLFASFPDRDNNNYFTSAKNIVLYPYA